MKRDRDESTLRRFFEALREFFERLLREGWPAPLGCSVIIFLGILFITFLAWRAATPSDTTNEAQDLGTLPSVGEVSDSEPVTDNNAFSGPTEPVGDESEQRSVLDVSGIWVLTVDVTVANGLCAGEENEPPYTTTITIIQDGEFLSVEVEDSTETWQGALLGHAVGFEGTKEEDDGTTTAGFALIVNEDATRMEGVELWSWKGEFGDCPDGESTVTATRR